MVYSINIDVFEGPLGLLLHLIRKNDLKISEIEISEITSDYLSYLNLIQKLNIDLASEFLVMASNLMQIKARYFLPTRYEEDEEDDGTLSQIKDKPLEYQKYKEVGKLLSYRIAESSQIYYRPAVIINKQDFVLGITVLDLTSSFRKVLKVFSSSPKKVVHQEVYIETKIREIIDILERKQYVSFTEILRKQKTKIALIVCFMAVLELVKNRQISAKQSKLFSEIIIYRIYNEVKLDCSKNGANALPEGNTDVNKFL